MEYRWKLANKFVHPHQSLNYTFGWYIISFSNHLLKDTSKRHAGGNYKIKSNYNELSAAHKFTKTSRGDPHCNN